MHVALGVPNTARALTALRDPVSQPRQTFWNCWWGVGVPANLNEFSPLLDRFMSHNKRLGEELSRQVGVFSSFFYFPYGDSVNAFSPNMAGEKILRAFFHPQKYITFRWGSG